jgi:hypothetical protein
LLKEQKGRFNMKRFNDSKISMVLFVFAGAIVLGSENVKADFVFDEPVNLGPVVNSPFGDWGPFIAPDGLTLYFSSERPGGLGESDIWVTTRATVSDAWRPPVNVGATVNSSTWDWLPAITADGLTLYFSSERPGGLGLNDIWLTTRSTKESPWGEPVNLGSSINSAGDEFFGCISADGCSLYFSNSLAHGADYFWGGDIYVRTRPAKDSPWGPAVSLGLMPSRVGSGNWDPSISADGLALFFGSDYVNTNLLPDIWLATRASDGSSWGTPILLGPGINTSNGEQRPSISADGRILYFCSNRPGGYGGWDIWQASIEPVVDFNADGVLDLADLVMMIDNWGTNETLYDIGPMPWGDGVVDIEDSKVFIKYWEQENGFGTSEEEPENESE